MSCYKHHKSVQKIDQTALQSWNNNQVPGSLMIKYEQDSSNITLSKSFLLGITAMCYFYFLHELMSGDSKAS